MKGNRGFVVTVVLSLGSLIWKRWPQATRQLYLMTVTSPLGPSDFLILSSSSKYRFWYTWNTLETTLMSGYSRAYVSMADYCPTINYKNRNLRSYCRKILINGIFLKTYMISLPGYFIPRIFSVIEVMEQVYLGATEFFLKIKSIPKAFYQWSQRFPNSWDTLEERSFAIITGLGQITVIAFQLAECKEKV